MTSDKILNTTLLGKKDWEALEPKVIIKLVVYV